jgi:hypothetical protein
MQNDEIEKKTHKKLRKKSDFQKKHLEKKIPKLNKKT